MASGVLLKDSGEVLEMEADSVLPGSDGVGESDCRWSQLDDAVECLWKDGDSLDDRPNFFVTGFGLRSFVGPCCSPIFSNMASVLRNRKTWSLPSGAAVALAVENLAASGPVACVEMDADGSSRCISRRRLISGDEITPANGVSGTHGDSVEWSPPRIPFSA